MSDELHDIEISTFEAKCSSCQNVFDHPSFGDHSYGKLVLSSSNGKIFAYCNLMTAVGKLLEVVLPENPSRNLYREAHAEFADTIFGQQLHIGLRCPSCLSSKLEYWDGKRTGSMFVKPVTYRTLLSHKRNKLIEKVTNFANTYAA